MPPRGSVGAKTSGSSSKDHLLDPDEEFLFDEDEERDDEEEEADDGALDRAMGQADAFDAEAANSADVSALSEQLVVGITVEQTGEPIHFLNRRRRLKTAYSPVDMGIHDGLAGHPDRVEVDPSAVVVLRDEQLERSTAIDDWHARTEQHLSALVARRERELELAELRHNEAMYRLVTRHPDGAKAGVFSDAEEAAAATTRARTRMEQSEASEQEEVESSHRGSDEAPATEVVRDQPPPAPVKPTLDQQGVASRELVWSLHPFWFWLGSILLFAAEFPFLRAVVRQLLLEPNPSELRVDMATLSVLVGFLIGTKFSGFLLRRAQSMFLLASLIHPERRPLPVRFWRWLRRRPTVAEVRSQASDPMEEGLRFGAWSRLFGALLLASVVIGTVFFIAHYRSEAAEAVALREDSVAGAFDVPSSTSDAEVDAFPGDAGGDGAPEDELPDVSQGTLQKMFLAIALLNVICAIVLAWASTKVPYEDLPADREDDEGSEEAEAANGKDDDKKSRRRKHRRSRRRPGERLEADVEQRRKQLLAARTRLAAAMARREHLDRRMEALKRLSEAQGQLDERTYWWANRASRRFEVDPDVDLGLAERRGTTPPPVIDMRGGANAR